MCGTRGGYDRYPGVHPSTHQGTQSCTALCTQSCIACRTQSCTASRDPPCTPRGSQCDTCPGTCARNASHILWYSAAGSAPPIPLRTHLQSSRVSSASSGFLPKTAPRLPTVSKNREESSLYFPL